MRPAPGRLAFVDALRGFALAGVFGANLLVFSGYWLLPDERQAAFASLSDRVVRVGELFLVENKFMGLFSFLFGVSFWLFMERAGDRGAPAGRLFRRRIGWLFAIGALHGWLLWCFDILRFYALWGMLLPAFARLPPRRLLPIAFGVAVLGPALVAGLRGSLPPLEPSAGLDAATLAAFSSGTYAEVLAANWRYDWHLTLAVGQLAYQLSILGRLLLGLWVARALALDDLPRHRRLLWRVLACGLVVGVAGNLEFVLGTFEEVRGFAAPFARRLLVEAGLLGFTLAYAAGLALAFQRELGERWLSRLVPLGRMALSAYLGQTLLGVWLFYGYPPGPALMGELGPSRLAGVWLVGYAAQVLLARAWMARFLYGPAEWAWRSLTHGRSQPMLREPAR